MRYTARGFWVAVGLLILVAAADSLIVQPNLVPHGLVADYVGGKSEVHERLFRQLGDIPETARLREILQVRESRLEHDFRGEGIREVYRLRAYARDAGTPYTVTWRGFVRVRQSGPQVFRIQGAKHADLRVGASAPMQTVAAGEALEVSLEAGWTPVEITQSSIRSPTGLRIEWLRPNGNRGDLADADLTPAPPDPGSWRRDHALRQVRRILGVMAIGLVATSIALPFLLAIGRAWRVGRGFAYLRTFELLAFFGVMVRLLVRSDPRLLAPFGALPSIGRWIWLAGAFAVLAEGLARWKLDPARERTNRPMPPAAVIVVGLTGVALLALWDSGFDTHLGADQYLYYAYAPSLLFDHDLDFTNQFHACAAELTHWWQAAQQVGDRPGNDFFLGPGILWSPFVALAWGVSRVESMLGLETVSDGYDSLSISFAALGTVFLVLLGVECVRRLIREHWSEEASLVAVPAMVFATPLELYASGDPLMSHGPSFFASSVLFLVWYRTRGSHGWPRWLGLGVVTGLASLVRPHNVMFAMPAVGEGLLWIRTALRPSRTAGVGASTAAGVGLWRRVRGPITCGLVAVFGCCAMFALQMMAWWRIWGSWPGHELAEWSPWLGSPYIVSVLVSPRNGLFLWHPVYAVALLGLVIGSRRDGLVVGGFALALIAQIYLNASSLDWWASGSFGNRRFTESAPLVAFGVAAWFASSKGRRRWFLGAFLVPLVIWSQLLLAWRVIGDDPVDFPKLLERRAGTIGRSLGDALMVPARVVLKLRYRLPWTANPLFLGGEVWSFGPKPGEVLAPPRLEASELAGPGWTSGEDGAVVATGERAELWIPFYPKADIRFGLSFEGRNPDPAAKAARLTVSLDARDGFAERPERQIWVGPAWQRYRLSFGNAQLGVRHVSFLPLGAEPAFRSPWLEVRNVRFEPLARERRGHGEARVNERLEKK